MSELMEAQWAVVSERGCEASDLTYDEARTLMQHLTQEKVSGLAIVTAAAARRFSSANRSIPSSATGRKA
jgi:hypothetical protein